MHPARDIKTVFSSNLRGNYYDDIFLIIDNRYQELVILGNTLIFW
jgi:hypothetical protein